MPAPTMPVDVREVATGTGGGAAAPPFVLETSVIAGPRGAPAWPRAMPAAAVVCWKTKRGIACSACTASVSESVRFVNTVQRIVTPARCTHVVRVIVQRLSLPERLHTTLRLMHVFAPFAAAQTYFVARAQRMCLPLNVHVKTVRLRLGGVTIGGVPCALAATTADDDGAAASDGEAQIPIASSASTATLATRAWSWVGLMTRDGDTALAVRSSWTDGHSHNTRAIHG